MEQEKIILQKYEPLIYKVAKNFYNVELCDLYQAGSLGLIKAYRNYNENVGKNFINFAYMYIYGEMFEFVNNSQTIKLNKEYLRLSKSIKKAITLLQEELGRTPTTTELSAFLEIDEETIINILNITKESVSLDDKIITKGDTIMIKPLNISWSETKKNVESVIKKYIKTVLNIKVKYIVSPNIY